jgi:hypothetical protein
MLILRQQDLKKSKLTASEEDLLIEDLLIEDLLIEDLSLEDLSLVLVDLALEDPSKEYHFDDCEEKAHLLIDYFANVIFESLPFARGY